MLATSCLALPAGPDYSHVDTEAKAEELLRHGRLEKLHLMPLEWGGADILENTVYVPLGFAEVKRNIDRNIVGPLVAEGKATTYTATPQYSGASCIPTAVTIVASDPASFTTTINIWGPALRGA